MARGNRPVKGFRPGREPPQLRKRQAKQQFGELSGTQERLVELFSERTKSESHRLMRRWMVGLLAAAIVLAVVAAVVSIWSVVAAVVVGFLALVALVLLWRLRSQREALDTMIEAASRPG